MDSDHVRDGCRPCAYFKLKADGCRKGSDCEFCHDCSMKDIRRRRRLRAKALKRECKLRQQLDQAFLAVPEVEAPQQNLVPMVVAQDGKLIALAGGKEVSEEPMYVPTIVRSAAAIWLDGGLP
mmetsp:Transcript_48928/g.126160  ORF Transcript_48928/g.126160 Transcript_48928/m.126160 type:complete len:123 (+) Transcript_48928:84-452(+)